MSDESAEPPRKSLIEGLRPLMGALHSLANAAQVLGGMTQLPAADSIAMSELAEEQRFKNDHWIDPVQAAHSVASILKFTAADHLRNYARMFETEPPPVYSHLVVSRACIDAAGQAHWIGEPGIGAACRIQRNQTQRLKNVEQLHRSPMPANKTRAKEILENVRAGSAANDWLVNRKKLICGEECFPSPREYIAAVVDPNTPPELRNEIGDDLWWFQSGVTHSSNYAIGESIDTSEASRTTPGMALGKIHTDGRSVILHSIVLGRTFINLIESHIQLTGWVENVWKLSKAEFDTQVPRYLGLLKRLKDGG